MVIMVVRVFFEVYIFFVKNQNTPIDGVFKNKNFSNFFKNWEGGERNWGEGLKSKTSSGSFHSRIVEGYIIHANTLDIPDTS